MARGSSRCVVWQRVFESRQLWIGDMNKPQTACVCMPVIYREHGWRLAVIWIVCYSCTLRLYVKSSFWCWVQTEAKLLSTHNVCCVFMCARLILCLWGCLNMFEGGSQSHLSKAVTGVCCICICGKQCAYKQRPFIKVNMSSQSAISTNQTLVGQVDGFSHLLH